jgi:hypothetical protein
MNDILRSFNELLFYDPKPILVKLRTLEKELAASDVEPKVRALRTNGLKEYREKRDAAIFTYGMGVVQGAKIVYAPVERSDFDFVTMWHEGTVQHFCAVQLKELVPEHLNPTASLQSLIDSTMRYSPSTDTIPAVKLNREGRAGLNELNLTGVPFKQVWFFWASAPGGSEWTLFGDALTGTGQAEFAYPESDGAV